MSSPSCTQRERSKRCIDCERLCLFSDYEAIVKLSDGFNGADLRNVCTEAGLFAIRADREYVTQEDFMKAVRKVADSKKLESKLDYKPL
ncbi:26S protease regulatory subunit 10B [Notothenia coriiceps]|uniref:26S protease regulatory subunit 10B n=1 Tax=Notothenia coriiceps TaxID=8208 RepID=A0A6I9PD39_9TELE|nr:PREDICTED: 26S protease regulatory subunit 10B [Notothenia coriiceps]